MVEINIQYDGSLRCRAVHEPSGTQLNTDAPKDNQGLGQSFSPTDLVATALGSCMMTIMGIVAQRHQIDLKGASVKVLKDMTATSPRKIAKLTVEFNMPKGISAEHRQMLETAAHACPVSKSLHPDVQVPVSFKWK